MTKYISLLGASMFVLALSGCSAVTSGMPTTNTVTGEAWYVKTTSFVGLPVATHIYFCPKQTGKGPAKCVEALVHEGDAASQATDMAGGFGAPPPQQQPGGYPQQPQPGYGAPQQPGGYGVPQQPTYGTPPGGYGAPTGGYQQPTAPAPQPQPQPPVPGY